MLNIEVGQVRGFKQNRNSLRKVLTPESETYDAKGNIIDDVSVDILLDSVPYRHYFPVEEFSHNAITSENYCIVRMITKANRYVNLKIKED